MTTEFGQGPAWSAETGYKPAIIYFAESGHSEFVATDEALVYSEEVVVQAVRDMETRELRGFAWYGKEPSPFTTPPAEAPVDSEIARLRAMIAEKDAALEPFAGVPPGLAAAMVAGMIMRIDRAIGKADRDEARADMEYVRKLADAFPRARRAKGCE